MQITVNKEIITILNEYGICSDYYGTVLIVLHALKNKEYELLDVIDNENEDRLILNVYKDLEMKFILSKTSDENPVHFELTDDGNTLLEKILKFSASKVKRVLPEIDLSWLPQWLELWKNERGVFHKAAGGYSLGSTLKDVQNKFIGFFTYYSDIFKDIPKEEIHKIILNVTANYISKQKSEGFQYTRKAMNFISKIEGQTKDTKNSDLAMLCEEYINKKDVTTIEGSNLFNTAIN